MAKILAFLTPTTASLLHKFDRSIIFWENRQFFAENCRKSQKILIITSTPERQHLRFDFSSTFCVTSSWAEKWKLPKSKIEAFEAKAPLTSDVIGKSFSCERNFLRANYVICLLLIKAWQKKTRLRIPLEYLIKCFYIPIFLWPMPLFLFSTHKQCILSHFINISTGMFP
jgi:hypothetical protein